MYGSFDVASGCCAYPLKLILRTSGTVCAVTCRTRIASNAHFDAAPFEGAVAKKAMREL
jgi:hypothetical protein